MLVTERQEAGPPRPSDERRRRWSRVLLVVGALAGVAYAYWKVAIPTHRVDVRSELVALGDLDGDRRWTGRDLAGLDAFLADPFAAPAELAWKLDLNRSGLLDPDDLRILRALVATSAREAHFRALISYAQQDPRYLRAVSRTSRRLQDPAVENHNLPMVLLFREALRITGGDKKRAVGLLDEAIRIPYAWMKPIPREALPGSLALENFLLPGNMEDGADKSRHWNVFGGICLYKSPEALELALRRELQDLRDGGYTAGGMREFLRDMIANLNGMYHVITVDPGLLGRTPPG